MHDILEFQQASRSLAFRRRLEQSQWDEKYYVVVETYQQNLLLG